MAKAAKKVVEDTSEVILEVADKPAGRQKKQAPKLTATQQKKVDGFQTKSAKIRYLFNEGYDKADIARSLGIIYQHVRNVLNSQVKTPKESIK